jgi:hypothetical protein
VIQAPTATIPATAVRAKIDEILTRPEFGGNSSVIGRWFRETLEKILRAIGDLFGVSPRDVGDILVVVLYVALAAALGWIVWRIYKARSGERAAPAAGPVEIDPDAARRRRVADLRRNARSARTAGNYVLSLRLYFTALVVGLGEKGDLEYRDAWTNRELLERGEPREQVERKLAPLVRDLDAWSFGGVPALEADVDRMSHVVDELLGAEGA